MCSVKQDIDDHIRNKRKGRKAEIVRYVIYKLHCVQDFFWPMPPHVPYGLRGLLSRLWPKCNRLWGWDVHEAQIRCPDELGGNI
jgi:hypothetical protein